MLENLKTEKRNLDSMNLDELSIFEIIDLMNKEDLNVIAAVKKNYMQLKK